MLPVVRTGKRHDLSALVLSCPVMLVGYYVNASLDDTNIGPRHGANEEAALGIVRYEQECFNYGRNY